jgi:hypothetical protein
LLATCEGRPRRAQSKAKAKPSFRPSAEGPSGSTREWPDPAARTQWEAKPPSASLPLRACWARDRAWYYSKTRERGILNRSARSGFARLAFKYPARTGIGKGPSRKRGSITTVESVQRVCLPTIGAALPTVPPALALALHPRQVASTNGTLRTGPGGSSHSFDRCLRKGDSVWDPLGPRAGEPPAVQ